MSNRARSRSPARRIPRTHDIERQYSSNRTRSKHSDLKRIDDMHRVLEENCTVHEDNGKRMKEVVIGFTNAGYVDMAKNCVHFFRIAHPDRQIIVFTTDSDAYESMRPTCPTILFQHASVVPRACASYAEPSQFQPITITKLSILSSVLELGYSIFFTDFDVIWRESALNDIRSACGDKPAVFQCGHKLEDHHKTVEVNTGLMYITNCDFTKRLFQAPQPDEPWQRGDQEQVNYRLNTWDEYGRIGTLDCWVFPNGDFWANANETQRRSAKVVHFNYLIGKTSKVQEMHSAGYWVVPGTLKSALDAAEDDDDI